MERQKGHGPPEAMSSTQGTRKAGFRKNVDPCEPRTQTDTNATQISKKRSPLVKSSARIKVKIKRGGTKKKEGRKEEMVERAT